MKAWIKKVFGFGIASFLSDAKHEMTVSLIPVIVAQFIPSAHVPFMLGIIASITVAFGSFLYLVSCFASDMISRKKTLIAIGYALSAIFSTILIDYRFWLFWGSSCSPAPPFYLLHHMRHTRIVHSYLQ